MKIHFKKVLNGLGVDKYQVSDILKVKVNYALDLIMYDETCHKLSVADIRRIRAAFRIPAEEIIEDDRVRTMRWKDIKKLLDGKAESVRSTLGRWNWPRLKKDKFAEYPLAFLEQLCNDLDINFRELMFR